LTDYDGNPRVFAERDIGADEYDGTTFSVPTRIFYVSQNGMTTTTGCPGHSQQSVHSAITQRLTMAGKSGCKREFTGKHRLWRLSSYLYGGFAGIENQPLATELLTT